MTENEAKDFLQGKLDCMNKSYVFDCKGTDECDNCQHCYSQGNFGEQKKAFETAIKALEEIQQYRAIGTVDEFKALKEKSVAKKPLHQGYVYVCPCCNDKATIGSTLLRPNQKYCTDCGTEFDWQ